MIPLLILLALAAIAILLLIVTRAPGMAERSEHARTKRRYREAVLVLERTQSDPLYTTTIDFEERTTAVVDHYYKEN